MLQHNISSAHDSAELRARQAEHLFQHVFSAPLVSVAAACAVSAILWGAAHHWLLVLWVCALTLINLGRLTLSWLYKRQASEAVSHWIRLYCALTWLSGFTWGLAILVIPSARIDYQLMIIGLAAGLVSAVLPLLAIVNGAFPVYMLMVLGPILAKMLSYSDTVHMMIGVIILLYIGAVYRSGRLLYRTFTDNLLLRMVEQKRADRDGLTDIANRGSFEDALRREWERAMRGGDPLSLVLIDIDDFKRYNDFYGHVAGDECLRKVAQALAASTSRKTDLVARYGGEEFVALLPATDQRGGRLIAEALCTAVCALRIPHRHSNVAAHVTISAGGATLIPRQDTSPAELIKHADQALYDVKRKGKARCAWLEPGTQPTSFATVSVV